MDPRGTHLIGDFSRCRQMPANAQGFLRLVADAAGLAILGNLEHKFGGEGGETALLMLATSHASIHTWPERSYVSFDLYSCRPLDQPTIDRIKAMMRDVMDPGCAEFKVIGRGHAAAD